MGEVLRVLLDTNIYGEIIANEAVLAEQITHSEKIIIYGCKTIRNELRDTPKEKEFNGKKLRILLLTMYDEMIKGH